MDLNRKAQLLAFYASAHVRLSKEDKRPKNLIPLLLKFGREIFGVSAETPTEMADKIDAMGRSKRGECCRIYRASHGIAIDGAARINEFPATPQKLKLTQNQPDYVPPCAPSPNQGLPSAKKLRKLSLAAKKEKRAIRKATRRAKLNAVASAPAASWPTEDAIRDFYASWDWKRLSYDVKLERGRKCECCGAKAPDVRIHTDHVKPIRRYWHLRLSRSNLQILCEDCNMGKGSRDETDFRQPVAPPCLDIANDPRAALDGPAPADGPVIWN
jgi:5-methylcytosine-specific restriction endonuclease McrA